MRDDEQLVVAALAGEVTAFAALVDGHRARVLAVVERMLGDEAEDVVQEALLRAYLGLSELRDPVRFGAWLCGIALNVAKMRLRRRALETRVVTEAMSNGGRFHDREALSVLRDAIDALPAGQRDAVVMHYVEGLSCEEIAALVGTSPGAIRVRLHRAREELRGELGALAPLSIPKKEMRMIETRLDDVLVRVAEDDATKLVADQRIVLLKEAAGDRLLPIWIGAAEGDMLALRLAGERTPRPFTSDLMAQLVRVVGARVDRVVVSELREDTFYATIAIGVDGRIEELDARPSDALNLAVRAGAPVFVDQRVLEQAAIAAADIPIRLDVQSRHLQGDLPRGEWRSLSAELVQSLYRFR